MDLSSPPPVLSHRLVFPIFTTFYWFLSVSSLSHHSLVCAHWSIVYKVLLHHLYFPFLIYAIQAYIWSYSSKSLGSLPLYFLSQILEGLLPYHSFNLLNNCIIDIGLLVSIAYDCLFSKETSLYISCNIKSYL